MCADTIAVIVRGEGELCRTQVVENIDVRADCVSSLRISFNHFIFVLKSEIDAACLVSFKDILLHHKFNFGPGPLCYSTLCF